MNKNNNSAVAAGAWCPDYSGGEFWALPQEGESQEAFQARIARAWETDKLFTELEAACLQICEGLGWEAPGRGQASVEFALEMRDWWGWWHHLPAILMDLARIGAI